MATLPGAWRYRVSAGTGRPGVSILWLGEMESLICNLYLSVAARKLVWADLSLRYTRVLLGCSATNKQTNHKLKQITTNTNNGFFSDKQFWFWPFTYKKNFCDFSRTLNFHSKCLKFTSFPWTVHTNWITAILTSINYLRNNSTNAVYTSIFINTVIITSPVTKTSYILT